MQPNNYAKDRLKAREASPNKPNNRSCSNKPRRRALNEQRPKQDRGHGEVMRLGQGWKKPWMHCLRPKITFIRQWIKVTIVFPR